MHLLLATIATDRETERRRDIEHRHALDLPPGRVPAPPAARDGSSPSR